MSLFSDDISKLLSEYKLLLKRYLSSSEANQAIATLGIKRSALRTNSDADLYNKAQCVVQHITSWTEKLNSAKMTHSGIKEFYQHLTAYLDHYQLDESGTLIHTGQQASGALVKAIQLITLERSSLSEVDISKLHDCIQIITQFGTQDQRNTLTALLSTQHAAYGNGNLSIYSA